MFVSWWNGEARVATVAISKKPILEAASMTTLIYSYYIANCNKSYFRGIIESLIDVRPHVMVVVVRSSLAITKRCWQAFHDFLIFSSCFSLSIYGSWNHLLHSETTGKANWRWISKCIRKWVFWNESPHLLLQIAGKWPVAPWIVILTPDDSEVDM